MIPIDLLKAVTTVVVHKTNATKACPDGRAAALLAHAVLPEAKIIEMAYNSPEHVAFTPRPGVLFADFSPWLPSDETQRAQLIQQWRDAQAIVLDHHDPKRVEPFGELGIWGDNAKVESGAWLVYREVFCRFRTNEILQVFGAELAGLAAIRDTWKTKHPQWAKACAVSAALAFTQLEHLLELSKQDPVDGFNGVLRFCADLGPVVMENQRRAAEQAARHPFWTNIYGRRVAILDKPDAISDAAELLGDKADIVAAFEYVHESDGSVRMVVHLRSRGDVDVREIAKQNGGDGHKNASGFKAYVDPWSRSHFSPYREIAARIEAFSAPPS